MAFVDSLIIFIGSYYVTSRYHLMRADIIRPTVLV